MKKLILNIFALTSMVAVLSSCSVTYPIAMTDNALGSKVGVASKSTFLGICFDCDLGIGTAAKNGGIKKVATVDYKIKHIFFITKYETIVTGE